MMKLLQLFDDGHQWYFFGRDPDKPEKIIDTNQYLVKAADQAILVEPGGSEVFAAMLAAISDVVALDQIGDIFVSHQDPDLTASLALWDETLESARVHASWMWEGFLRHFGQRALQYVPVPDEGSILHLGDVELHFIPAHFLHSPGNLNVYDPKAKILMCGDLGAALEPPGAPVFVEDFHEHTKAMRLFHQRWIGSEKAKKDWIYRVRELDVEMLAPQHGRIFRGDDVKRFLDWFEQIEVGVVKV